VQISERVRLVGSGKNGFQTSHPLDCNVFLLDGGTEHALIDAGSGVEPERIAASIEDAGVPADRVKHLLLTHAHGDHAAGARYFRDLLGVEVTCSKEAAPWLEQGDVEKTSIRVAIEAGVYPDGFRFDPCPVASPVADNDKIPVGNLELRVLETPGHSRGHVSYLWMEDGHSSLFGGDTVFAGGKILIQNIWDCSLQEYAKTARKLDGLRLDSLYPGHGPFLLSRAHRHIEQAHSHFQSLRVPPNL
jgi:glyoxylase-like metal-dependent hydrolase (beta-lactamase superfamily II)